MLSRISNIVSNLFSINWYKTLRFNFHYFNFVKAIKIPCFVYNNVEFYNFGGTFVIDSQIKAGMIKIGQRSASIISKHETTIWDCDGKIIFKGKASIGNGCCISIGKYGAVIIGNDFSMTGRSTIDCNKKINIGDNCLLSWDILIMDSDYHVISNERGKIINRSKEINIGNHVWIGCRNTILKGTILADNTIVAACSMISKRYETPNVIIGGVGKNTVILKENVQWNK